MIRFHDPITAVASNPEHVGIIIGGLVLVGVYLYLGTRAIGPDDNYWGPLRRTVLPLLDRVLAEYGGYATNQARAEEFVGTIPQPPEAVERHLYAAGYRWNFAAGLKTNPEGVTEYSSWARRHVDAPRVRRVCGRLEGTPVVGLAPELVEGVLARRQVHVTLFAIDTADAADGGEGSTEVYAHEEPNALNPLLFVAHYRGDRSLLGRDVDGQRVALGIRTVARDLLAADVPIDLAPWARELVADHGDGQAATDTAGVEES